MVRTNILLILILYTSQLCVCVCVCVCVGGQINNDRAAIDCGTFSHCVIIIQQIFYSADFCGWFFVVGGEEHDADHIFSFFSHNEKQKGFTSFSSKERSRWQ